MKDSEWRRLLRRRNQGHGCRLSSHQGDPQRNAARTGHPRDAQAQLRSLVGRASRGSYYRSDNPRGQWCRRYLFRHHRAKTFRGQAPPHAEAGEPRRARWRCRTRLQQPAGHDSRQRQLRQEARRSRSADRSAARRDRSGRATCRRAHQADARLLRPGQIQGRNDRAAERGTRDGQAAEGADPEAGRASLPVPGRASARSKRTQRRSAKSS